MSLRRLALIALIIAGTLVIAGCTDEEATATQPVVPTTSVPSQVTPATSPESSPSAGNTPGASPSAGSPTTTGDAAAGEELFSSASPTPCNTCHSTGSNRVVGPGLAGVGERAATRVPGLTADEYIQQSIREPTAFTVPGFPEGVMPAFTGLSDEDVSNLIAYLKTLQ